MVRSVSITIFAAMAVLVFCGCASEDKSVYPQLKLSALAPSGTDSLDGRSESVVEFNVYFFESPPEDFSTLNKIWEFLYREPLRFSNRDAFAANGFVAGKGNRQMWDSLRSILRQANVRTSKTVSLLIAGKQGQEDIPLFRIGGRQRIFHTAIDGQVAESMLHNGVVALRINSREIIAGRGICQIDVLPVFKFSNSRRFNILGGAETNKEILFRSAGVKVKLSPGEFILLGPQRYSSSLTTLNGLFFTTVEPEPIVKMYLILCRVITD